MKENRIDLRSFRRRVRLVRGWRGLAVGLLIGGTMGVAWAVMDLMSVWFTEWAQLGILVGTCGLVGLLVGGLWPVNEASVARSVDRRAGLRDRLGTMMEREGEHADFDDALRNDAQVYVGRVKAKKVFPVRVGRWQYLALVAMAIASMVFLLGNNWYMLSPELRETKQELAKIAASIERVARPLADKDNPAIGPEEHELARELKQFAKRLEKGRLSKEEAMQIANELAKKAQKLAEKRVAKAQLQMQTTRQRMTEMSLAEKGLSREKLEKMNLSQELQQMLQQMKRDLGMKGSPMGDKFDQETMEQLGLEDIDPSLMNLTEDQIDQLRQMIQEQLDDIERQLENASQMTQEELNELLQRQQSLQELQDAVQMSEEARKALEEFMNSPEYKDIMAVVSEMRKAARQVINGEPLTDQQIEEFEQMLDELDERLDGSKYQEMVMETLRAALEQLKAGCLSCEAAGT